MSDNIRTQTWRTYHRELILLYGALLLGLLAFFKIAVFLFLIGIGSPDPVLGRVMLYPGIPLTIFCIAVSFFMPQRIVGRVQQESPIGEKLSVFRTAMIIKLAFYKAPGLFILVAFIVSWEMYYLYMFPVIITLFIFSFPTLERVSGALTLSSDERMILQQNQPFEIESLRG